MVTCSVVVPAYNEVKGIEECLNALVKMAAQVPDCRMEILVVDDGSTDGTAEILNRRKDVRVVRHERNRGYGAALHTGIQSSKSDWIALIDSDGTYPIEQLPALFHEAIHGFDMVVGARKGRGISLAPHRALARWILKRIVWALTSVLVPDLNSGMRVFRRSLFLEFKHLLPFGFSFTTTLTVASLYCGYRVKYVEIEYHRRTGHSHIRPVQDFLGFVMLIIRLASYFEPLRFFLPLSFFLLGIGVLRGLRDVYLFNYFGGTAVILMMASLQVFLTGIIADVLVRRSNREKA